MGLRIPSFTELLNVARGHGTDSEAPELWDGLVGWWPMQEGGGATAYDLSGYGNNGTLTNGPTWCATPYGNGIRIAATSQYINFGDVSIFNGLTEFTIILTSYPNTPDTYGLLFGQDTTNGIFAQVRSSNSLGLYVNGDLLGSAGSVWVNQQWQQFAFRYKSGETNGKQIYVDTSIVAQESQTASVNDTASPLCVGDRPGGGGLEDYAGDVTNIMVWATAFDASTISRLYSNPWAMGRLRPRVFAVSGAAPAAFGGSNQIIGAGILGGQGV